jgi:radical SAM superfamily enzyme with C-terminal helix-hairpin-helix motif
MSRRLAIFLVTTLAASAVHAPAASPAWVARSNADSQGLLKVIAQFSPESASEFGLAGFDENVADLKLGKAQPRVGLSTAPKG